MSDTIIEHGSKLERSTDGLAWANVPEAKGIVLPETTQDYAEVTNLDSPGGFKEYIPGLKDIGEISFDCNYTRAGYAQQLADQNSGIAIYYRVTLKNGDVFEFQGFPRVTPKGQGLGEPVGMTVTIKGTGESTFTEGA